MPLQPPEQVAQYDHHVAWPLPVVLRGSVEDGPGPRHEGASLLRVVCVWLWAYITDVLCEHQAAWEAHWGSICAGGGPVRSFICGSLGW